MCTGRFLSLYFETLQRELGLRGTKIDYTLQQAHEFYALHYPYGESTTAAVRCYFQVFLRSHFRMHFCPLAACNRGDQSSRRLFAVRRLEFSAAHWFVHRRFQRKDDSTNVRSVRADEAKI